MSPPRSASPSSRLFLPAVRRGSRVRVGTRRHRSRTHHVRKRRAGHPEGWPLCRCLAVTEAVDWRRGRRPTIEDGPGRSRLARGTRQRTHAPVGSEKGPSLHSQTGMNSAQGGGITSDQRTFEAAENRGRPPPTWWTAGCRELEKLPREQSHQLPFPAASRHTAESGT